MKVTIAIILLTLGTALSGCLPVNEICKNKSASACDKDSRCSWNADQDACAPK